MSGRQSHQPKGLYLIKVVATGELLRVRARDDGRAIGLAKEMLAARGIARAGRMPIHSRPEPIVIRSPRVDRLLRQGGW